MADTHNEEENPTPLRILDSGGASSSMAAPVDHSINEGGPQVEETTTAQQQREESQNGSEEEKLGENSGKEEESGKNSGKEESFEDLGNEEEADEERTVNYRDYELELVSNKVPSFPARVTVRSSWDVFDRIKEILAGMRHGARDFEDTCFGRFLRIETNWEKAFWGQGVHYMLLHSVKCNKNKEMWFVVDEKPLHFGMMEYALVTGLGCGKLPDKPEVDAIRKSPGAIRFRKKVLQGVKCIIGHVLEKRLETVRFNDREKIKMCLVLFLHSILLVGDSTKAVENDWFLFASDLEFFNSYPWGRISFERTIKSLKKLDMTLKQSQWVGKDKLSMYNLFGFPRAM
ncbi:uncharacterized protein LOC116121772 isoform X2 [Pistacia vera]|nr:uncharacterized protein LOC116121772 isoform X2 [Pistacia vera]